MASSENDALTQEPDEETQPPDEPEEIPAAAEVDALATKHDPAARARAQVLDVAGTYYYDGDSAMDHRDLGRIVPGANEYTNEMHPEAKAALQELVNAGVLRKSSITPP